MDQTSLLWLFVSSLLFCTTNQEAQRQLIAARPGDNVTLPCEVSNYFTISAVEWIRSDLQRCVYLKSYWYPVTADQDPSYVNRVQLKDDGMRNGELSLILKNVNKNDEGTYECRYVEWRGGRRKRALTDGELISIVFLKVEAEPEPVRDSLLRIIRHVVKFGTFFIATVLMVFSFQRKPRAPSAGRRPAVSVTTPPSPEDDGVTTEHHF
ncbi:titin-like%2C partial [Scomber scombrus]|uniref:Titin-like, partial n=1 Tax=Scomber scombrus TaxID=13677 RepID=A0AAV1Q7Q1_SCOSC